jgi:hypothetical protein
MIFNLLKTFLKFFFTKYSSFFVGNNNFMYIHYSVKIELKSIKFCEMMENRNETISAIDSERKICYR